MKWRLIAGQRYRAQSGALSAIVWNNGADWSQWSITLSWTAEQPERCRTMRDAKAEAEKLLEEAAWTLAQPTGN